MSQVTDYVIDNGSGSAVRADLNNVLEAVKTCNAGSSAPSNPEPGMLWFDTGATPPVVRSRNTANTAWELLAPPGVTGQVSAFAMASPPFGWVAANGAALSRTVYANLFNTIGTTFGAGDGSTTFNVPDMRDKFGLGTGARALGATGGSETHTLTEAQMPSHAHSGTTGGESNGHTHGAGSLKAVNHTHGYKDLRPSGGGVNFASDGYRGRDEIDRTTDGSGPLDIYGDTSNRSENHTHNFTTDNRGGNQPHNNMPPYMALLYCIKF